MKSGLLKNYLFLSKQFAKVNWQLIYGVWKISALPEPRVTIFGGARVAQNSYYAKQAHALAHRLAQGNISVISGGGPGIMEAASCGISHEQINKVQARTLGITVRGLEKEPVNQCVKEYVVLDHFFSRKWLMINFSVAFAVFPGGFGTLNELAEVALLLQTQHLPGIPLVLFSKEYWQPFIGWLINSALRHNLIGEDDISLIRITDDVDEAFCWLQERCELCVKCKKNNKQ